jgi:homocysteine S-methyltransferase
MCSSRLTKLLTSSRFACLDGGFATELERRGFELNTALWSAAALTDNPDLVKRVHTSFLEAGCDVIGTGSYQISSSGYAHEKRADWKVALLQSVSLAEEARKEFLCTSPSTREFDPLVAVSMGPLGAAYHDGSEYTGCYGLPGRSEVLPLDTTLKVGRQTLDTLMAFHREKLVVLRDAGVNVDIIAFETIPCAVEGQAIAKLLALEFPEMRAWISFSCQEHGLLASGEALADAVASVLNAHAGQVVAVGVNCCAPAAVLEALQSIREITRFGGIRLLVYPNSGEKWDSVTNSWCHDECPAAIAPWYEDAGVLRSWLDAGCWAIGGCCRTTPSAIRSIREIVTLLVPQL